MNKNLIKEINLLPNLKNIDFPDRKYHDYLEKIIDKIYSLRFILDKSKSLESCSEEFLRVENQKYFEELLSENYLTSYSNFDYSVKIFGEELGKIFSFLYKYFFEIREACFENNLKAIEHKILSLKKLVELLTEEYTVNDLNSFVNKTFTENLLNEKNAELRRSYDPKYSKFSEFIHSRNISRRIYLYGKSVQVSDLKLADVFNTYSIDKLNKLANQIINGYIRGFKADNKDISPKTTVQIFFSIGQEKLVEILSQKLNKVGLSSIFLPNFSSSINDQYKIDHNTDDALFLNTDFNNKSINMFTKACDLNKKILNDCSGRIGILRIDPRKTLEKSNNSPEYSKEQIGLKKKLMLNNLDIKNKYIPKIETSFTIIALATPGIVEQNDEKFKEIFDDVVNLNLLDSELYENIQHEIIKVLDQASSVHILGENGNKTDLRVMFRRINNPSKETNFLNGGATLNIPAGELFTTPKLKGTNGILHVKKIFLRGLSYSDLWLKFRDGKVSEYSCENFEGSSQNRKYIKENLFYHHDTLPMGEFAIGTNTIAYSIARKHGIENKLPILITEKMGTHFAVGDPCFARGEDNPVYNLIDGKEVVARENELTCNRNEKDVYTNCHTDITLPYDEIKFVRAELSNNEFIDIIKDGKFVLPGTEILNKSL